MAPSSHASLPNRTAGRPHLDGSAYVNHIALDDAPEKIRASYGTNYRRLSLLKARYDPTKPLPSERQHLARVRFDERAASRPTGIAHVAAVLIDVRR